MMETQNYWEDSSAQHSMPVKYESLDSRSCKDEIYRMGLGAGYCEGNLNFATASEDDEVYSKKKVSRQDPMSHRIIEKRRRDRMNNCLADLSRLIPSEYLKKGRGRVEKTEIIEMAIRHMKHLQGLRQDAKHHTPVSAVHTALHTEDSVDSVSHPSSTSASAAEHYRLGYQECLSETMHFLVEVEGFFARDNLYVQLISHLQQHCDKILAASDRLGFPHPDLPTTNGSNGAPFAHVNAGLASMCPTSNLTTNGINLHNNNNNNNNNSSTHNNNNNNNNNGITISQHHNSHVNHNHHNSSSNSDRCSSSGVSSFDSTESTTATRPSLRPSLIPPPNLVSDDSNHSSHSHGSGSMLMANLAMQHHHHHHHHHDLTAQQRPTANYKFKNSIKQRFSADQRIKTSASPPPSCNSGSSSEASPKHSHHQGVPIFALHDNGGFYVPLTVEASLLRPQMGYSAASDLGPETVLHPVTISVNFNHSPHHAWSQQPSPTHQIQ